MNRRLNVVIVHCLPVTTAWLVLQNEGGLGDNHNRKKTKSERNRLIQGTFKITKTIIMAVVFKCKEEKKKKKRK